MGGRMLSTQLGDFLADHPQHKRVLKLTSRIRKERCMRDFCKANAEHFRFHENLDDGPGKTSVEVLQATHKGPVLHLVFQDATTATLSTRFVAGLIDSGRRA